jgi:hypothetical protein
LPVSTTAASTDTPLNNLPSGAMMNSRHYRMDKVALDARQHTHQIAACSQANGGLHGS